MATRVGYLKPPQWPPIDHTSVPAVVSLPSIVDFERKIEEFVRRSAHISPLVGWRNNTFPDQENLISYNDLMNRLRERELIQHWDYARFLIVSQTPRWLQACLNVFTVLPAALYIAVLYHLVDRVPANQRKNIAPAD